MNVNSCDNLDFSSWQTLLLESWHRGHYRHWRCYVGLLVMQTVQQRRDRENRQINERLRTLIAAYKTLGGSFTGSLEVDPRHKRDLKRADEKEGGERARRIRDAVEAALSDIILLGTEEQVRLAAAAREPTRFPAALSSPRNLSSRSATSFARRWTSLLSQLGSQFRVRAPRGSPSPRPERTATARTRVRVMAAVWAVPALAVSATA